MNENPYLASVITYIMALRKHYQRHVYWRYQWLQLSLYSHAPKPVNRPRPESRNQMHALAQKIIVGLQLDAPVPGTLDDYGRFILSVERQLLETSNDHIPVGDQPNVPVRHNAGPRNAPCLPDAEPPSTQEETADVG